jgi:uncharacterized protein YjdB
MANLKLSYNATTKVATVQYAGDAIPAGSTLVDTFSQTILSEGDYGLLPESVLYTKVRELLEAELGIINMQFISIVHDITYTAVTALSITPATVTLAPAATQQITLSWTPVSPSNTNVTYTTSDATKATVSSSGLITAVASGSATITATSQDGGFTDTVVVTVS